MRAIDADRLKAVLEKNFGHTGGASVLEQLIDEQPTIQPETPCYLGSPCEYQSPNVEISQPVATDTNVGDKISKFIDGLEEIFADIRERHVDDSVCGLCEYDGAYMGQSGDWCNECPGFEKDDCFKLSDETRKKWTDEIIKALPTVQSEPHYDEWCDTCKEYDHERHCCPRWNHVIRTALQDAKPEPQEGHWIPHETPDGGEQYECSECGVLWEFNDGTPEDNEAYFCPRCGAKMTISK